MTGFAVLVAYHIQSILPSIMHAFLRSILSSFISNDESSTLFRHKKIAFKFQDDLTAFYRVTFMSMISLNFVL